MAAVETMRKNPFVAGVRQTKIILEMIKFEHTIFMLPFALMAAVIAGHHHWLLFAHKLPWILLAMVGARSAAMAFNRIVDREYDAQKPPNRHAGYPRRAAHGAAGDGVYFDCIRTACICCVYAQPAGICLVPSRPNSGAWLFLHQALYAVFAFVPGAGNGSGPGGSVDCGHGPD